MPSPNRNTRTRRATRSRYDWLPRPLRAKDDPRPQKKRMTYHEAVEHLDEVDGKVIEVVRVKGRMHLQCVGATTDPIEQQRPYTLVLKEEVNDESS